MTGIRFVVVSLIVMFAALPARGEIARVDLNGAIDPVTAGFVVRSITRAENEHAKFLLVRLQTPGGFSTSMEEIITKMLSSRIPVVVFVAPSGAKAASAGFFKFHQ